MAVGFRRRLMAFTMPKASSVLRRRTRHKKLTYSRTRSTSLPGRFHPVVAGLHESAAALVAWTDKEPAQEEEKASTAWIGDGVARLGRVMAGLTNLLHHPQAQDPLKQGNRSGKAAPWAERLLDDLLLLADAHACFRDALLALKTLLAEARAALRRHDAARLAAALRARRRSDRDLSRLASTLRCLTHRSSSSSSSSSYGAAKVLDSGEAALAEAVAAATCAAAAASAAIFSGLASASASSVASRSMPSPMASVSPAAKVAAVPVWWVADLLRWRRRTVAVAASTETPGEFSLEADCCDEEEEERQAAVKRLRSLEDCVVAAEDGCGQVYRALVNARVSLLNVMTPCF